MTKEEWAKKLNHRIYGEEITNEEKEQLSKDRLVVIIGASDDLAEIYGSINDEVSVFDGGNIHFINGDLYSAECEDESCPHEVEKQNKSFTVIADWCDYKDYSWSYRTEIPHCTFDILEERKRYCRGIIFDFDDICGENK